jgi:hypothetical protein
MSGTALDVILEPRLGPRKSLRRQRVTIGSDVLVWLDVRDEQTGALVPGATGLAALYWLPGTRDDESAAQALVPAEDTPGTWIVRVPTSMPGSYVVWWSAAGQTAEIVFDVSSAGDLTLTSTGTVPWGDVQAAGAAAGRSAAVPEARRVAAEVAGPAGAAAAGPAAIAAIAPQVAQVDADAMAVELSRQEVAAAVQAVPAQAAAAATPAGAAAGTTAANAVVAGKVDRAGGVFTANPTLAGDATAALHPVPKQQADATRNAIPVYQSRAWVAANTIPASVTDFVTEGFYAGGDGGGAQWRRVAAGSQLIPLYVEAGNPGVVSDTSGALFVMTDTTLGLRKFGARGTAANGTTIIDDSLAANYLWDWTTAVRPTNANEYVTTASVAPRAQPSIRLEPGRWRLWNAKSWESVINVGIDIAGQGAATQLDGLAIGVRAFRFKLRSLVIMDSRGIRPGSVGLYGDFMRHMLVTDVTIRDRDIGVQQTGGGTSEIPGLLIEKCNVAYDGLGGGDTQLVNQRWTGNSRYGRRSRGIAEMKTANSSSSGHPVAQAITDGDSRRPAVENYDFAFTTTGGVAGGKAENALTAADLQAAIENGDDMARAFVDCAVINNGVGGARVVTSPLRTIAGVAVKSGIYFARANSLDRGEACFDLTGNGGTVSGIMAGGAALLAAPVPYSSSLYQTALNVVAAINAAGTGYNAEIAANNRPRVYIDAPLEAGLGVNGRELVVSTTGALGISAPPLIEVTTAEPHGFTANHPVYVEIGGNAGVEPCLWSPTATTFVLRAAASVTGVGVACIPNRWAAGTPDVFVDRGAGTYSGKYTTLACGPNYIDLAYINTTTPVPFTVADAGVRVKLMSWDTLMRARDTNANVNDQFRVGGNDNYALHESGYNNTALGVRSKAHVWLDQRLDPQMAPARYFEVRSARSRSGTGLGSMLPAGTATGWHGLYSLDDIGVSTAPGTGYVGMVAPHAAGGLKDGRAAKLNVVGALETGLRFMIAGEAMDWTPLLAPIMGHRLTRTPTSVIGVELVGANSGGRVTVRPTTTDAGSVNAGLNLTSLGTGSVDVFTNGGAARAGSFRNITGAVNYLAFIPAVSGSPAIIAALGSDPVVGMRLNTTGGGTIVMGAPLQVFPYTFATLPLPSAQTNNTVRVTDRQNRLATSDGTNWRFMDNTIAA